MKTGSHDATPPLLRKFSTLSPQPYWNTATSTP